MSKPISFGFGAKPKTSSNTSTPSTSKPGTPKPISFPSSSTSTRQKFGASSSKNKPSALRDDSDDEDEAPPKHEELTGFSATGAILSKPKTEKAVPVIENAGNGDWRKRGKNLLPAEVQATRNGENAVTVEKDEGNVTFGLQYAAKKDNEEVKSGTNGLQALPNGSATQGPPSKEMTDDERALARLLDDGTGKPQSTTTIAVQANDDWAQQRSETDNFREDVALRPDSSTLEDYAAMPVEEFGMALLRGMGRKRRANGEIIDFNKGAEEDKKRKERKQEGFLGIGAKPVKGLEGVELGAWGKSDMRKNNRGEGFFTPVMIEDRRTGERITEEEFERRKKAALRGEKSGGGGDGKREEDWRDRRDRNLEKSGRNGNGDGDVDIDTDGGSSRKRARDYDEEQTSRSRRDRERERERDRSDRDHDSSRSRRHRSRSRDRRPRDDEHSDDPQEVDRDRDRDRDRRRERHRGNYRDEDRYESSSSRRSEQRHRNRDRDRGRDRDRDRDDRGYRERR